MSERTVDPQKKPTPAALTPASSGLLRLKCACGDTPSVDGECTECRKKRLGLQRSAIGTAEPAIAPPIVHEVLRSPGQPLDAGTQRFMETRLGHNFSRLSLDAPQNKNTQPALTVNAPGDRFEQEAARAADKAVLKSENTGPIHNFGMVRIYTDSRAADSVSVVQALAYTVGQNIVFGAGQYLPGTTSGRRLLAHELVHTVQQSHHRMLQRQEKPPASARVEKKRVRKVIVYLDTNNVIFVLEGGGHAYGWVTYNGNPDPGVYHVEIVSGIYSGIPHTGVANDKGYVVAWVQPKVVTFKDVTAYDFEVRYRTPSVQGDGKIEAEGGHAEEPKQKTAIDGLEGGQPAASSQPAEKKGSSGETSGVKDAKGAPAAKHADGLAISETDFNTRFDALPERVKKSFGDKAYYTPEYYGQVLRIGESMAELSPDDWELFLLVAKNITDDLDLIEESLKKFKELIAGLDENARALLKEWAKYDEASFKKLSPEQKKAWARKLASLTATAELKKFLTSPGEWAKMLAEGVLPPVRASAEAMKDFKAAISSGKSGTKRAAYLVGGLAKSAGMASQMAAGLALVLLLVPGVNVGSLIMFGLGAALASMLLSAGEAELHIQAAGDAPDLATCKEHVEKAAAAKASIEIGLMTIVAMTLLGIVAKATWAKVKTMLETAKQNKANPPQLIAPTNENAPTNIVDNVAQPEPDLTTPGPVNPTNAAAVDVDAATPVFSSNPLENPAFLKAYLADPTNLYTPTSIISNQPSAMPWLLNELNTKALAEFTGGAPKTPAIDLLKLDPEQLKLAKADPARIAKKWVQVYLQYQKITDAQVTEWNNRLPPDMPKMTKEQWAAASLGSTGRPDGDNTQLPHPNKP